MKPRFLTSHYAWIQGCYWMAYCILLSFSSVYLLDQGFSNTQIGLLLGLSGLLTALLQPFVGARADHLKVLSLGQFAALLILAMLLCTGGLLLLPGQAVQGGLFLSLLLLLQLLTSLLYALGMDCVNQGMPLNFGLARGVGAGSYALASTLCGSAAAAFGPKCIPVLLGGEIAVASTKSFLGQVVSLTLLALLLAAALSFRPGTPAKQAAPPPASPPSSPQSFWRRYPRFLPLLAGVVLLYTSHNILMSFPYQIVQYLGGGSGEMGTLLTLQGLMDIPAMVLFSLLLRRAASWRWVRLAGLSFFLHALLTWLAPSVFFLYGIQIFETTGYALYAVASVYWVNDMTAPADRVQGQTYFTMANTLGIVLSSFLGGFLLDAAGTGPTLAFSTVTGGTGMGILWIMLRQGQAKAAVQQG